MKNFIKTFFQRGNAPPEEGKYAMNFYEYIPTINYRNLDWKKLKYLIAAGMGIIFLTIVLLIYRHRNPQKNSPESIHVSDENIMRNATDYPFTAFRDFINLTSSEMQAGQMSQGIVGISVYKLISLNHAALDKHDLECVFSADYLRFPFNILTIRNGKTHINIDVMERSGSPSFVQGTNPFWPTSKIWFKFYPTLVLSDHTGANFTITTHSLSKCIQRYMYDS